MGAKAEPSGRVPKGTAAPGQVRRVAGTGFAGNGAISLRRRRRERRAILGEGRGIMALTAP